MIPLIDVEHKIIYFWSPRAGCTTLKDFYSKLNYGETKEEFSGSDVHLQVDTQQASLRKTVKIHDGYQTVIIIRDPFSRLISSFSQIIGARLPKLTSLSEDDFINDLATKIYAPKYKPNEIPREVRESMLDFKRDCTFRKFITVLDKVGINKLEYHFGPQVSSSELETFSSFFKMHFDKIIRTENLSTELDNIAKSFGKKIDIKTRYKSDFKKDIPIEGFADKNIVDYIKTHGDKLPVWQYYYDKDLITKIEQMYAKDLAIYFFSFQNKGRLELTKSVQAIISADEEKISKMLKEYKQDLSRLPLRVNLKEERESIEVLLKNKIGIFKENPIDVNHLPLVVATTIIVCIGFIIRKRLRRKATIFK